MSPCVTTNLSLTNHLSEANREDTTIQKKLSEDETTYATQESSLAEWDLAAFEQLQKSNPKWSPEKKTKPKRIQDISLIRLDSGGAEDVDRDHPKQDADGNWPYESSPCALFGKTKLTSMPAKGFDGEFSHGDPEWDGRNSKKNRSSGVNRRLHAAQQKSSAAATRKNNNESEGSESDYVSDSENDGESGSGSAQLSVSADENSIHSESDRSITESPQYESEEDVAMKTPAMGKAFRGAKKPPTLIRGGHQKATPSVVKALKGRGAFSSDDEDDGNFKLDPHAFDSDDDMTPFRSKPKGTAMDSGTYHGSSKARTRPDATNLSSSSAHSSSSRREGRLKAAQVDAGDSRKKNFSFDRAMSSADLRAARKANNSFKMGDMSDSINALGAKRRQNRKEQFLNHAKEVPSKAPGRKLPSRAKSVGSAMGAAQADAAAPGGKLKSALKVFSDAAAPAAAQGEKKKYASTISALRTISASTASQGGRACDIRAAIAQQVQRSAAGLEPMELKPKPRPKIKKSMSLSAPGMVAAMTPDDESPAKNSSNKDGAPARQLRRSKTSDERTQSASKLNSSISRMNSSSSHEKLARMRKQKMKDASERSAQSQASESLDSKNADMESSSKRRPANIDRRAKSFQQPRSGASLDNSPGVKSPQRQSSHRRTSADSPKSSSPGRRSADSPRSPRPYDASPQKPRGPSVIALLKATEPVTDSEMMQKGNRQMFHALMYRTKMGMNMDRLRRKVEGLDVSSSSNDEDEEEDENDRSGSTYGSDRSGSGSYGSGSGSE